MSWLELLTALAFVLAADQLTKRYALGMPRLAPSAVVRSYVSIRCIINRRTAFVGYSEIWVVAGWALCAAAVFLIIDQEAMTENTLGATGLGLVLGGVTGNVIDLLWRRGIVDFIALGSWTIFNVADVAILAGLGLTVLAIA